MPVLGLIFLRHADNRYQAVLNQVLAKLPMRDGKPLREPRKEDFTGQAAIFLPEPARYHFLATLPQGQSVGQAIDDAMQMIEDQYEILKGALPRGYTHFEPDLLANLLKTFNRPALKAATGDVFGKIYEYFLNKFAQTGAQEGGEFFTPPSLVRMIVNIIEPDHGLVLDPACGSAGMFVQTGHFIEAVRHQNPNDKVTFFGQEKSDTTIKLARMNLAVHGLDGNILQGNTFYEDQHTLTGRCDFVMANPPFNVDMVDTKRVEGQVGEGGRLPFGLPGTNAKNGSISNANGLWIQYFYAFLNATGRAGFVMASSASDAGNKDRDIRQKLVETGHVDVMMSIGPKFFYTRSLPCTLWFFDKGKPEDLLDSVLMIDARHVYHVVSARSHVFTEEQLANLSAIVWIYRGERGKFIALVGQYQQTAAQWLGSLPQRIKSHDDTLSELAGWLRSFADSLQGHAELISSEPNLPAFLAELALAQTPTLAPSSVEKLTKTLVRVTVEPEPSEKDPHTAQVKRQTELETLIPLLKAAQAEVEARHKTWLKLLDTADKHYRALASQRTLNGAEFNAKRARELKKALTAADFGKDQEPSVRDQVLEAFKQAIYFIQQTHWLHHRFPLGLYDDVPGLCKLVSRTEIAANDYSLTPGRYVGVTVEPEEDEEDFKERLADIHLELDELNQKAVLLAARIQENFEILLK